MEQVTITETINHGGYHNVRTETIARTFGAFADFLNRSPYRKPVDLRAGDPIVGDLITALVETGKASLGWADFHIEEA